MNVREELKNPSRRLPQLSLLSARTGAAHPLWNRGRTAPVIILTHGEGCPQCEEFLEHLAREQQSIAEWDGEVLVVRSGGPCTDDAAPPADTPLGVLLDPDERLARALAIEAPAVVVADQWAVVHVAEEAGADHRFIAPSEVADWVKYLAVQCPECEGESL